MTIGKEKPVILKKDVDSDNEELDFGDDYGGFHEKNINKDFTTGPGASSEPINLQNKVVLRSQELNQQ